MSSITLKDLSQNVQPDVVISKARTAWEAKNRAKQSLNDRIIFALPLMMVVSFCVFYLLSAPHTVGLIDRITPNWGWVAPVGLELLVVVLSVMRQKGWRNFSTGFILWLIVAISIAVNVVGGFVAVVHTNPSMLGKTVADILGAFSTLPAIEQAALILVVPLGVLIPIMGKFTGEAVVKLATGEIVLERVSVDDQWNEVKRVEAMQALYTACITFGAGDKTARNWANSVVESLYPAEELPRINARSNRQVSAPPALGFSTAHLPSFGQSLGQNIVPNSPVVHNNESEYSQTMQVMDEQNSSGRTNARTVRTWLIENKDQVTAILKRHNSKRAACEEVSVLMLGHKNAYKTIERLLNNGGVS
jgi:hypothetical protein